MNITLGQHMMCSQQAWPSPWVVEHGNVATVKAWMYLRGGQLLYLEEFNTTYCSVVNIH